MKPSCNNYVVITAVPAPKLVSSAGKTPKTKPSKSASVINSKGPFITKTTKKIKLDSSYFTPPPPVKSTPRKKTSSVTSSSGVVRSLSTPSSLTKVQPVYQNCYILNCVIYLLKGCKKNTSNEGT